MKNGVWSTSYQKVNFYLMSIVNFVERNLRKKAKRKLRKLKKVKFERK